MPALISPGVRIPLVVAACATLCGCASFGPRGLSPVDVNARDGDGSTPLMKAAYIGNSYFVETLLRHGAEVNARNGNGINALMAAVYAGRPDIARMLIEHGADVNVRDERGNIALRLAGERGSEELAGLLRGAGARE